MEITQLIKEAVAKAVSELYQHTVQESEVQVAPTRKEFEGDYTIVVFPFTRAAKKAPPVLAEELGNYLTENVDDIVDFNVIKGFLNLTISETYWTKFLMSLAAQENYGTHTSNGQKAVVEFSSPNTNKPLHLGHVRNILLGWSMSQILDAAGYEVNRVQIINDRGIHICKSMLAWQKFGNGETPESTGMKGDHLIGKYYVLFEQKFKKEFKKWRCEEKAVEVFVNLFLNSKEVGEIWLNFREKHKSKNRRLLTYLIKSYNKEVLKLSKSKLKVWKNSDEALVELQDYLRQNLNVLKNDLCKIWLEEKGLNGFGHFIISEIFKNNYFNEHSTLGKEAKEMLLKWEAKDLEIRQLWETMNGWVYSGFNETYKNLGVSFDKLYHESNTYLLGKDMIEKGLEKGVFYKEADGSVWADLEDAKLDKKIVLRSDGTSVYITQDLGTAQERYKDFQMDKSIYVVGNEQDHHFKVLFEILKRMGESYAENLYHLSYGMVELPSGKMKSREGTVVDADDLMKEVVTVAKEESLERGDVSGLTGERQQEAWRRIGMAALKFHMIRVTPRKNMLFDPKESVDIQGQSGPFVQYSYVRTKSVLAKAGDWDIDISGYDTPQPQEKELLILIRKYPDTILEAAKNYDPSLIANYAYELAKSYNKFFHDIPILRAETAAGKGFRLTLTQMVGRVLTSALDLLGIEVPERM